MQVKDQINQWRNVQKPKKGGSGQIFELLYFQNRKEFAADFFCVFILPKRWTNSMNMSKIWRGHLTTFLKSGCFGMEWP